jgi:RNA polymerase sigma-70 factor (family 1)
MIKKSTYPSEDQLLADFRSGDEQALNYLFKNFYRGLCFFALKFTNDTYIAEELTLEVFHRLWERRQDFFSLPALKSFLYVSVRNAAINHLDKEKRRTNHKISFYNGEDACQEPIIDAIIQTEILIEIQNEINALPEQCSKIIKMLYELDMKPDEIASELNISRNTVYSQKLRGLALLKKRLSAANFDLLLLYLMLNN